MGDHPVGSSSNVLLSELVTQTQADRSLEVSWNFVFAVPWLYFGAALLLGIVVSVKPHQRSSNSTGTMLHHLSVPKCINTSRALYRRIVHPAGSASCRMCSKLALFPGCSYCARCSWRKRGLTSGSCCCRSALRCGSRHIFPCCPSHRP
jgi:hypothetical protein